jgi:hypothetical protein
MSVLNEIFERVCVCRSFRLSGLNSILQRFPPRSTIETTTLPYLIGDFLGEGYVYIRRGIVEYIVTRERAEAVIPSLNDPTECTLHDAWHDWYEAEFEREHGFEYLAELLYHEAVYFKKCTSGENILKFLQSKVRGHLWNYCRSVAEDYADDSVILPFPDLQNTIGALIIHLKNRDQGDKLKEVSNYIPNLADRIKELNRFDGILSDSEYEAFINFLDSLNA